MAIGFSNKEVVRWPKLFQWNGGDGSLTRVNSRVIGGKGVDVVRTEQECAVKGGIQVRWEVSDSGLSKGFVALK